MKKVKAPRIPAVWEPANARRPLKLPKPAKLFSSSPAIRAGEVKRALNARAALHCTDGPAVVFQDGGFEWWRNGQVHRDGDLPAVHVGPSHMLSVAFHPGWNKGRLSNPSKLRSGTDLWCVDGYLHREGKPAVCTMLENGGMFKEYWCNGRRHNSTGPAVSSPTVQNWFYHGLLHRDDGPAFSQRSDEATHEHWLWYGDLLMKDSQIEPDFPFADPPPTFLLTALLGSDFSRELVESARSLMSKHVLGLMPDFHDHLSVCCDEFSWEVMRAQIEATLHPGKIIESYPLPENFDLV